MPSRAWPDSARAIINSALKVRIRPSDSSIVASSAARYSASRCRRAQRLFGAVAQARERRLQIMGDVVGDFLQARHQRFDAVEHGVEVVGETVEFVAGAGDRQPVAEIAFHDVARRLGHGVDAVQHAPRDEEAAGEAEHDHDRHRPTPRREHDVVEPLALLEVAADQQAEAAGQFEHAHQRVVLGTVRIFRLVKPPVGGLGPARYDRACRAPAP